MRRVKGLQCIAAVLTYIDVRLELSAAVKKSSMPWSGILKSQYVYICWLAASEQDTSTARRELLHGAAPNVSSLDVSVHAAFPTQAAVTTDDTSREHAGAAVRLLQ